MHGSLLHSTPPPSQEAAVCTDRWTNCSDPTAPSWYHTSYPGIQYCEKGCAIRDGLGAAALNMTRESMQQHQQHIPLKNDDQDSKDAVWDSMIFGDPTSEAAHKLKVVGSRVVSSPGQAIAGRGTGQGHDGRVGGWAGACRQPGGPAG